MTDFEEKLLSEWLLGEKKVAGYLVQVAVGKKLLIPQSLPIEIYRDRKSQYYLKILYLPIPHFCMR